MKYHLHQHDNDPKNTADVVKHKTEKHIIEHCNSWVHIPSMDFNITEAMWDYVNREQNKSQTTFKEELWNDLQAACRTIIEEYLKKLQGNLFKRV